MASDPAMRATLAPPEMSMLRFFNEVVPSAGRSGCRRFELRPVVTGQGKRTAYETKRAVS
jgi:hypothetical protein